MNLRKLLQVKNYPRYIRWMPNYMTGVIKGKTIFGDTMIVTFPEFRCIKDKGILDAAGDIALTSYLWETLRGGDTFFDIGANAGWYALLAAHKGAKVHAFEPFPSTFKLLRKNCDGKNILTWNVAVSDSNETRYMKHDDRYANFSGWNTISPHGTVRVAATSLDQFAVIPTVIKIDVEGHEKEVLRGAQEMLKKHKPIVITENKGEADFLFSLGYTNMKLLGNERSTNYLFS